MYRFILVNIVGGHGQGYVSIHMDVFLEEKQAAKASVSRFAALALKGFI
jgi:hypothetical protein